MTSPTVANYYWQHQVALQSPLVFPQNVSRSKQTSPWQKCTRPRLRNLSYGVADAQSGAVIDVVMWLQVRRPAAAQVPTEQNSGNHIQDQDAIAAKPSSLV